MIGSFPRLQSRLPRYKSQLHQLPVELTYVQSTRSCTFQRFNFRQIAFHTLFFFAFHFTLLYHYYSNSTAVGRQSCATKSSKDTRYAAVFTTGTPLIHVSAMVSKAIPSLRRRFWWDLLVLLMQPDADPSKLRQISSLAEVAHGTILGTPVVAIIHLLVADEVNSQFSCLVEFIKYHSISNTNIGKHSPSTRRKSIQASRFQSMDTRQSFP
ncbi:hypothetical protein PV11_02217 [Exophiala sideris]|uniref:Uncharacterized protein n=1 Tax=Exophiala sideris TaxID=1016849 RepID=A0A0D1YVP6_9EURO|nr:hypothetical protein PV11_02217 [Exophiala sideris]